MASFGTTANWAGGETPADTQMTTVRAWVEGTALAAGLGALLLLAGRIDAPQLPGMLAVVGVAGVLVLLAFVAFRERPAIVVGGILVWFAFHKLVIALASPTLAPGSVSVVYNFKEWLYLALFAVGVGVTTLAHRPWRTILRGMWSGLNAADRFALAFLLVITVYFLIAALTHRELIEGALVYARRFASLPLLYLTGRMLVRNRHQFQLTLHFVVAVAFVVAAFGLVERLLLGPGFWTGVVHVQDLQSTLMSSGFGSDRTHFVGGVPDNWLAYISGRAFPRLVSSFMEPTTLSMFLALALLIAVFGLRDWRRGSRITWAIGCVVIGVATALTMGKGGLMIFAIGSLIFITRATRRTVLIVAVPIGLLVVGVIVAAEVMPVGDNIRLHLAGLTSGVLQLVTHPFGAGLGSTGFWAVETNGAGLVGRDSSIGSIASQVGVLGAALFCAWLAALTLSLLPRTREVDPDTRLGSVFGGAIAGLLVVAVLSDSATGLLASAFYVLLGGWLVSLQIAARDSVNRRWEAYGVARPG
jgi:hypothetical protein